MVYADDKLGVFRKESEGGLSGKNKEDEEHIYAIKGCIGK